MGIIRDSFVIFKNWADAINALPDEFQLETYKALVKFGTTGEIPEGLSQVANAMLVSFSVGMEKNITRYTASVENGKKGGRPKKEKPTEETEQPSCENENLEKPSKTQENQTEPTQNLYVHDNVNVIKLVKENKNINNYQARVQAGKARQPFIDQFAEFFEYTQHERFLAPAYEVIDTMLNFLEAVKETGFTFKGKEYDEGTLQKAFEQVPSDKFSKIVEQLVFNQNIKNREYYILGCLLNGGKIEN